MEKCEFSKVETYVACNECDSRSENIISNKSTQPERTNNSHNETDQRTTSSESDEVD